MSLPKHRLPSDCLLDIFIHFRDDKSSLYSCVLVNRLWCRLAIPLLWSQPLELSPEDKHLNIIETYFSCLSNLDETKSPDPKPFFNYPKFLKRFNSKKFRLAINKWLATKDLGQDVTDDILKLLFTCSDKLIDLGIVCTGSKYSLDSLLVKDCNALFKLERFNLTYRDETDNRRSDQDDEAVSNLMRMMSRHATNIKHLCVNIILFEDRPNPPIPIDEAFSQLLLQQNNLISLEMTNFHPPSKVFSSLTSQASTLKELKLSSNFSFDDSFLQTLISLKNLETLHLNSMTSSLPPSHLTSCQLSIKHLHLTIPKRSSFDYLPILLSMISNNLQKLVLTGFIEKVLQDIMGHCPNIQELYIDTNSPLPKSLLNLLSSSTSLKYLELKKGKKLEFEWLKNDYATQFSTSLPRSLRHFSLQSNISVQPLKIFLDQCKVNFDILELYKTHMRKEDSNVLNLLMDYSKKNSKLKELRLHLVHYDDYEFKPTLEEIESAKKYLNILVD